MAAKTAIKPFEYTTVLLPSPATGSTDDDAIATLNALGDEGWQLVVAVGHPSIAQMRCILMRPKINVAEQK